MATEIVRWCDAHMATDERVPGGAHALQVDGKSGTVDLCTDHAKVLLGPLLDILAPDPQDSRGGGSGSGRKITPGPARCFLCPAMLRPVRMADHLKRQHHTTLVDVYGLTCPLCGLVATTPQGMGSHGASTHGRNALVDLWVAAEEAGDTDGVVAARRALVARS